MRPAPHHLLRLLQPQRQRQPLRPPLGMHLLLGAARQLLQYADCTCILHLRPAPHVAPALLNIRRLMRPAITCHAALHPGQRAAEMQPTVQRHLQEEHRGITSCRHAQSAARQQTLLCLAPG